MLSWVTFSTLNIHVHFQSFNGIVNNVTQSNMEVPLYSYWNSQCFHSHVQFLLSGYKANANFEPWHVEMHQSRLQNVASHSPEQIITHYPVTMPAGVFESYAQALWRRYWDLTTLPIAVNTENCLRLFFESRQLSKFCYVMFKIAGSYIAASMHAPMYLLSTNLYRSYDRKNTTIFSFTMKSFLLLIAISRECCPISGHQSSGHGQLTCTWWARCRAYTQGFWNTVPYSYGQDAQQMFSSKNRQIASCAQAKMYRLVY